MALPLTGSPEQQCRITATTFIYLSAIFLAGQFYKHNQLYTTTNSEKLNPYATQLDHIELVRRPFGGEVIGLKRWL
jgi:hypothetical protein